MERILNDDEKIRKAESIYFRRNNINKVNTNIEKSSNIKDKLFLHTLLIINIIVIIICIQNKDFIFTKEFLNNINQYNVNLKSKIIYFVGNFINTNKTNAEYNYVIENSGDNYDSEVNINEKENTEIKDEVSSISEMDTDIKNLKAIYNFIKPVDGIVTSPFGVRTSENKKVEGYHTGIDISANTGTPIQASIDGIVTLVSAQGDYGKHIKLRCNNVTTLYAHCSKIYVKEGQIVARGQKIAEVGSTGNSTGPHLHFEIRIDDSRFVDPGEIIL